MRPTQAWLPSAFNSTASPYNAISPVVLMHAVLEAHQFARKAAHASADNASAGASGCCLALPWCCFLWSLCMAGVVFVDPLPRVVFVPQLVVGVFTQDSTAGEDLACLFNSGTLS